jgi:hypothetical protein
MFNSTYITNNAAKFLDYEWVNIRLLREYVPQTVIRLNIALHFSHNLHLAFLP